MATKLDLASLNEKDAYIQKIKKSLETAVGQKIAIINIEKLKRVAGVSACPVEFIFAGNQQLKLFIRSTADVFKATLNGKTIVLTGDFSNDLKMTFENGVNGVAKLIRNGQKSFEKSIAKEKVRIPKPKSESESTPKLSTTAQLKAYVEQEQVLDKELDEKRAILEQLKQQVELVQVQGG